MKLSETILYFQIQETREQFHEFCTSNIQPTHPKGLQIEVFLSANQDLIFHPTGYERKIWNKAISKFQTTQIKKDYPFEEITRNPLNTLLFTVEKLEVAKKLFKKIEPLQEHSLQISSTSLDLLEKYRQQTNLPLMHHPKNIERHELEKHAALLSKIGISTLCIPKQLASKGTVLLLQRFGLSVYVDELTQLRELIQAAKTGADGILSKRHDYLLGISTESDQH